VNKSLTQKRLYQIFDKMENIFNAIELAAIASIAVLYNLSHFREKMLEFKLTLDKEIAPIHQKQNDMEGELRRIDAVVKSEDVINVNNVNDYNNNSLLVFIIAILLFKKYDDK